jgi:hypothetical protein
VQLDSEKQRETLLNCIQSAQISGLVVDLFPALAEIATLIDAVKAAPVVEKPNLSKI